MAVAYKEGEIFEQIERANVRCVLESKGHFVEREDVRWWTRLHIVQRGWCSGGLQEPAALFD